MTKTTKEMIAVMQAYADGKPVEYCLSGTSIWMGTLSPAWVWGKYDYRIAVTKPSIDWSHVDKECRAMAMDGCGIHYLYKDRPSTSANSWVGGRVVCRAEYFASFRPGTCDWRDSLVERPEGI